ncbi:MAG: hypothetical protein CM15mP111_3570 [Hyphomicrobiales bacterium]|nr:MAG: hypothetical protein CM15mP111_3570 [Hyphomicrobiales bacterium]
MIGVSQNKKFMVNLSGKIFCFSILNGEKFGGCRILGVNPLNRRNFNQKRGFFPKNYLISFVKTKKLKRKKVTGM